MRVWTVLALGIITVPLLGCRSPNQSGIQTDTMPSPTAVMLVTQSQAEPTVETPEVTIWPTVTPVPPPTSLPTAIPYPTPRLIPGAAGGYPVPDVTLTTLDGEIIQLSELRGKIVVLDFWAMGCPGCAVFSNDLEQAHRHYGDEVVFVGISLDPPEVAARQSKQLGLTYPQVSDEGGTLFIHTFGGLMVPTFLFVDEEGIVQEIVAFSPLPEEELFGIIDNLLD